MSGTLFDWQIQDARFFYINGSFNYAFKFVLLTNGFGVPRFVQFIDKEFTSKHDSLNHCFSGNPLKDKAIHDSILLEPVLNDFFKYLHFFNFHSFLADSAFDKVDHYNLLFDKFHFSKVFIPLNKRNSSSLDKDHISFEDDIPFCNKEALFFKYCGKSMGKGRSARLKFLCPLSKFQNAKYRCLCKNPCTSSSYGRTVYTYPKNYRDFPGLFRGSKEFTDTYKKRTVIEASISSLKTYIGLDDIKSRNSDSIKVDLLFACISKVVCAFVAYNSSRLPDLKSFNRLFKASWLFPFTSGLILLCSFFVALISSLLFTPTVYSSIFFLTLFFLFYSSFCKYLLYLNYLKSFSISKSIRISYFYYIWHFLTSLVITCYYSKN